MSVVTVQRVGRALVARQRGGRVETRIARQHGGDTDSSSARGKG